MNKLSIPKETKCHGNCLLLLLSFTVSYKNDRCQVAHCFHRYVPMPWYLVEDNITDTLNVKCFFDSMVNVASGQLFCTYLVYMFLFSDNSKCVERKLSSFLSFVLVVR